MAGPARGGAVIPFYGADDRARFAIERRCMDRDGAVLRRLDDLLPRGDRDRPALVLDTGAGDGYTADRLTRPDRRVVALEPAAGMLERGRALPWVRGAAQGLPFRGGALDAAYATWAYFFPELGHGDAGLAEWHRVVRPGGTLVFVDNAGDDAFSALGDQAIASDPAWWAARGFVADIVATSFRFDTLDEARALLGFYFGDRGRGVSELEIGYRVAVYTARSRGPSTSAH